MFKNITLEISLKPFKKTDSEYIRGVVKKIFTQWAPLLKGRETISVMLWASDGSEILDYAGELSDEFEWARFIGTANLPYRTENEPKETSLHERKQDYIENAPVMTYGTLKAIISAIKEEGKAAFPDAKIRVGETFDIGPEFAISDFKYNRHREISSGYTLDKFGFVDATATLKGDTRRYAAYPDGIPDGTLFGTFLGKQSEKFLSDMGFDYLWLSNGLGFSSDPWLRTGKIFDGEKYYPEKLGDMKNKVFAFWKLFREECSFPLETRGTNNSVGIDYASDGVPLYDIYNAGLDITAPPNSPWAAINDNYGLEMMGHMTRICELPDSRFPFRYYLHDPWWVNSPWYDRYDGTPCDIYLPMAISRLNENGEVESANTLNILSIDNSYGELPDACANEVIPHLLKAEKDIADEPAPIVWVYPMREYTTSADSELLRDMNLGDNFIMDAINSGFPLACVSSTDNFLKHNESVYKKSVILSPAPETDEVLDKLLALAKTSRGVIIYATDERLSRIPDTEKVVKVSVSGGACKLSEALAPLGYEIKHNAKTDGVKVPTMAISRRAGAHFISVYNSNTTTETTLKFPHGAPILNGCETEINESGASYRFARAEHRECRIFAEQKSGVISCREAAPVNARYRRAIVIRGLDNATVRLFSETGCESAASVASSTDFTPIYDERFVRVKDARGEEYLEGKGVSGDIYFLIGKKGTSEV